MVIVDTFLMSFFNFDLLTTYILLYGRIIVRWYYILRLSQDNLGSAILFMVLQ